MPIEILMPALSPTMTEGTLARWMKAEGDQVSAGDIVAEIETDKATMEVEAVDEGTLGKILVAGGTENVAVNTPIALLLADGEDASALDQAAAKPAAKAEKPAEEKKEAPKKEAKAEAVAATLFTAPEGEGDDLTKIKGIGPVAAKQLNEQGITTYAQIAKLSDKDITRIDEAMPFSADQISDWRDQAKAMK